MTIILDYVSNLFHLLIAGELFTTPLLNQEIACMVAKTYLSVTLVLVLEELKSNSGDPFRISWLRET